MLKNKRGVSGTEMIVSFALFITSLIFIFIYLIPLATPPSNSLMTLLETAVNEKAGIEVEIMPFAVNKTLLDNENADCFQIASPISGNIFLTDENEKVVEFKKSGENLVIKKRGKFYYVKKGINGENPSLICSKTIQLVKDASYSLSVKRSEMMYLYENLRILNNSYYSNYNGLKQEIGFPVISDFSIIVFDSRRNEIINMKKPLPKVNVLAKEFPIEILSSEDGIKTIKGYMRLMVW
ncbi:MAG: hypothetical protein QW041_03230 [Candidatus Pacearchaeota archaeon]